MSASKPSGRNVTIPGLLEHLRPEGIALDLEARTKPQALARMVDVALALEPGLNRSVLMEALAAREAVVTTGIGRGMAIPHADLPAVPKPMLCLGIFPAGVDFDSLDDEPVCAAFLLLGTGRDPNIHMQLLSDIAKLSKEPRLLPQFLAANTGAQVFDFLQEIAEKTGL